MEPRFPRGVRHELLPLHAASIGGELWRDRAQLSAQREETHILSVAGLRRGRDSCGGNAEANGFMISTSASTVIGFSLTGASIDANGSVGCMDEAACNYSSTATISGECEYSETNYDCSGNCVYLNACNDCVADVEGISLPSAPL